jgi:4-amino-4-deoxy-L-arabinose transferase-like glycosyltransferase
LTVSRRPLSYDNALAHVLTAKTVAVPHPKLRLDFEPVELSPFDWRADPSDQFDMNHHQKAWLSVSIVICVLAIYVYPLTLPTPLLDPDEGLHASISQEMVENGDYVMPRHLGTPFLDKPILYFDAQALSLRYFGMNESAVRLPGLLFGLLGAITAAILARRLFDTSTAQLTLIISLTSVVPLLLAQAAVHDVALVPWTNSLFLCWWEATRANSLPRRIAFTIAAAVFAGLAILTKGLIGLAVVVIGYLLYVVINRKCMRTFVVSATTSLSGGLLLVSPWLIAMERRSPGYLYYYFVQRHILGFATHSQPHGNEPWYFYLLPLTVGTAPWILYAFISLRQAWGRKGRRSISDATLLVACWLLGGLVFLSLAKSKLIPYALPLYPAIAILAGHACKQFLEDELLPSLKNTFEKVFNFCCVVGCLSPIGILFGIDQYNHEKSPTAAYLVATLAILMMALSLLLMRRGYPAVALAAAALWFPLVFVTIMTWPLQTLAERHSQRKLAHEICSLTTLPDRIELIGSHADSLIFYLKPAQRRALGPGQIAEVPSDRAAYETIPPKTLLAMRSDIWTHMPKSALLKGIHELPPAADYRVFEAEFGVPHVANRPDSRLW